MKRVRVRVRKDLAAWGKRNVGSDDLKVVLDEMHEKRQMSQKQIANKFKVPLPSIRYWLKKHGLLREDERRSFSRSVKQLGYRDVADFFTDPNNVRKTLRQLSDDTGFCTVTVSQWYNKFLGEKRKGKR
jgi:hypothetical protein